MLSLTESLAEEWAGSGVTVTALCPGITATPMLTGAAAANSALSRLAAVLAQVCQIPAQSGPFE